MRNRFFPVRNTATRAVLVALSLIVFGLSPTAEADDYARLDAATKRWLELEQKIASERNSWKAQKQILEQSVRVLEADIEELLNGMERLKQEAGFRASEFEANTETLEEQETANLYYTDKLDALSDRFDRVRGKAPAFLKDELDAAREKFDNTDEAALGERAQILIAAFTRIEEFNRAVSIDYQPRSMPDGREVMVSVLYWGMARGYAVDPQGTIAWELVPGEEDWEWRERSEYADRIVELVRVYEQTRPPSIQSVPGSVLNQAGGDQ